MSKVYGQGDVSRRYIKCMIDPGWIMINKFWFSHLGKCIELQNIDPTESDEDGARIKLN